MAAIPLLRVRIGLRIGMLRCLRVKRMRHMHGGRGFHVRRETRISTVVLWLTRAVMRRVPCCGVIRHPCSLDSRGASSRETVQPVEVQPVVRPVLLPSVSLALERRTTAVEALLLQLQLSNFVNRAAIEKIITRTRRFNSQVSTTCIHALPASSAIARSGTRAWALCASDGGESGQNCRKNCRWRWMSHRLTHLVRACDVCASLISSSSFSYIV